MAKQASWSDDNQKFDENAVMVWDGEGGYCLSKENTPNTSNHAEAIEKLLENLLTVLLFIMDPPKPVGEELLRAGAIAIADLIRALPAKSSGDVLTDLHIAFVRLAVMTHYENLFRWLLKKTRDEQFSEDICQAALAKAIEKTSQLERLTTFRRWIITVARRLWFNEIRRRKTAERHQNAIGRNGSLKPNDCSESDIEAVIEAVRESEGTAIATIAKMLVEGGTQAEIAAAIGWSERTVRKYLGRTRSALLQALIRFVGLQAEDVRRILRRYGNEDIATAASLVWLGGFSYREAADKLNKTPKAVRELLVVAAKILCRELLSRLNH